MKKLLLLSVFGPFLLMNSHCQELLLLPNWTEGSTYQCVMNGWKEELRSGEFQVSDSSQLHLQWTVTKVLNDRIELMYSIKNPMYTSINHLMDEPYTNEKLENVDIPCVLSLDSGILSMSNWQELSILYTRDLNQMKEYLQSNQNEMSSLLHLIIDPYHEMLGTQKGVESIFLGDLQFLLKPYCKTYKEQDTLKYNTTVSNPLKEKELLKTTEFLSWSPASTSNTHIIDYRMEFDMTDFKKIMLEMTQKMMEAMGGDAVKNEKKMKELESAEMEMASSIRYEIDANKNEMKFCNVALVFSGHDGRKPRSTRSFKTYTITSKTAK